MEVCKLGDKFAHELVKFQRIFSEIEEQTA